MENSTFPRNAKLLISVALLVGAFAMYWAWGLMYGSWNMFAPEYIGVYSIVGTLFFFGIVGLLLTLRE
ncbi:MAG: hypothetical protein ACOCSO_01040 [Thermoplasmatota archaeon]